MNLVLAMMGTLNFLILLYELLISLKANYHKVFVERYRARIVPLVVEEDKKDLSNAKREHCIRDREPYRAYYP